ncbi:octaprenyl-diphosphate synthase [Cohaesibacter sp. ES.047]|uniref:polyprenyl synthetase family protein n=1 Tax=Cohaesibacter sp. ES.047 TaxID=1798205 RepID=UPI000BC06DC7|nr:polyprenyl synthetase family protein [Cohaesibacter sp. ES.047]SNY92450.1 octaprenyl-diphosphate synthase [Cohaesibacter sp. ES.047]
MSAPSQNETKKPEASIQPLIDLVQSDMDRVNDLILSKAGSDVEMIPEVAKHLIDSGGKRLRPMLTLASAGMCGYGTNATDEAVDGHIKLAMSVEFMHTATLLHDDVVDESGMRRGKLSARMLWGNQASVLVGDFLLGQAFRVMVEVGSLRALEVLSSAACIIAEGEVLQLSVAQNMQTSVEDYMKVIRSKTAALFASACEVGPILAGSNEAKIEALRTYGLELGNAFQLIDDALDYGGSAAALGKNVGDDFREGKITLPIILANERGSKEDKAFWKRVMQDRKDVTDGALDYAMGLLKETNALEDTLKQARQHGSDAIRALDVFEDSAYKSALVDAVEFCISRAH